MFTKFDRRLHSLLCCPLCKGQLTLFEQKTFLCHDCASKYPQRKITIGEKQEKVYDFRIHHPSYCVTETKEKWGEIQKHYEQFHQQNSQRDAYQEYLNEINSVEEIYTREFHLSGRVLDVGGHQGRLRYFLEDDALSSYISVDPYLNVFEDVQHQSGLLKAYPVLNEACNFLACYAEHLPFKSHSFDWVHMRSVLDHFNDPYLALKEAYRVLQPGGRLLLGLAIVENIAVRTSENGNVFPEGRISFWRKKISRLRKKIRKKGVKLGVKNFLKKDLSAVLPKTASTNEAFVDDDHLYHFSYANLVDLLEKTSFRIDKEHWQKPPWEYVLYVSAISMKSGANSQ